MKIGFMGGSFDPVHLGHLGVARVVAQALALDQVWMIPAAQAPLRADAVSTDGRHRTAMLRLATAGDGRFLVSEIEIQRGGVSYTVDTLRALRKERPSDDFFWILGEDQLARLPRWSEPDVLCGLTEFVCYSRPGYPFAAPPPIPGLSVHRVEGPTWSISSTMIRERLQRGEAIQGLVPDKVIEYIQENGLYT
ncbi:MAG: hypothetical protein RIQ79_47 [Verrucomicrobiota bacterium]